MKILIEVGACDGADSLRYHSSGYTVYAFEPKRDLYEHLIERTKYLVNYNVIPKAVCLFNGTTTFNICKQGGASSILNFRNEDELNKTWSPSRTDIHFSGISYEVPTTRLDTFIEEAGLQEMKIDFLHIDAQGVDLDVLKSMGKYIVNLKEGVLETVINPEKTIYSNQTDNVFKNVEEFLYENGFTIIGVFSNDSCECEYNVRFKRTELLD